MLVTTKSHQIKVKSGHGSWHIRLLSFGRKVCATATRKRVAVENETK